MFLLHVSQVKKFDFVLVSVHLKAAGLGNSDVERLEVSWAHKLKFVIICLGGVTQCYFKFSSSS